MSTIWEIPLSPRAQRMVIDMGGIEYTLHFNYNRVSQTWIMDVHDANDVPFINGIPLVTGTDLLGQFRYMGIGGGLPVVTMTIGLGHSPDEIPTYENLGVDSHVYYKTLV